MWYGDFIDIASIFNQTEDEYLVLNITGESYLDLLCIEKKYCQLKTERLSLIFINVNNF